MTLVPIPLSPRRRAKPLLGRTFLLVPGLYDSDPGHWQSCWQREYGLARVVQSDWTTPDIRRWSRTLEKHVREFASPIVILAHSFGCLATVVATERIRDNVQGALLVAPADPNKFGVATQLPHSPLPFPSIVVGSRDDPWMDLDWAQWWAQRWGSAFIDLGTAGHINTGSGYGDWPQGWDLAQSLANPCIPPDAED
jgi:predicted alpha/beta hydrolase family esterase